MKYSPGDIVVSTHTGDTFILLAEFERIVRNPKHKAFIVLLKDHSVAVVVIGLTGDIRL